MDRPHRSRRAALTAVALTGLTGLVVAAAWTAGPAGARDARNARDAGTNLASNPVLATNDQGWGVLSGGSGHRVTVDDHGTAGHAYQVDLTGDDAGIYLPQQTVSGGATYSFAVDARTSGTAHIQIDWYGSSGFLGSDEATGVAVTAGSWTTVTGTFTAPAGAVNSHPLEYVTGASGTWLSTAADYEQKSGGTDPTDPGDTAAGNFDWGTPLPQSDEFDYTGAPDPDKWDAYGEGGDTGGSGSNCWPGHAGNGRRCAGNNQVADGHLRQTGEGNGDSAGLASDLGQRYGRWEVRARVQAAAGASGNPYHPVLITWPDSDEWPEGGEYDFFEVNVGDTKATAFLHHPSGSQDEYQSGSVDLSQWHNYGFEWTSSGLTGYLDGQEWFHDTDSSVQAPGPMHLTIQLDDFFGAGGLQEAYFDVDWAHIYALN